MACKIEVIFTPVECRVLRERDLGNSTCVVFDVLRATSTMVMALAAGAHAIIPVEEISEAIVLRKQQPNWLLAGERGGLRIREAANGGMDFDLGNSPREFTADKVAGRTIITTTTNGTRSLRACARAGCVLTGSFLNLTATALYLTRVIPSHLLLVCAGTGEQSALEDVLAAGALCELLTAAGTGFEQRDSAQTATLAYRQAASNISAAVSQSENAQRLLMIPDLRDDVEFCLRRDAYPLVGALGKSGAVERVA